MEILRIYPARTENLIDHRILGHFVEQFPGNIPHGIYDPKHPLADEDGFRSDLLCLMRDAGVTQLRWAGNFSSDYHWENGVGPQAQRPRLYNTAWHCEEDNGHGTAEFIKLCRKLHAEPVIGVNMGNGTAEEAMHWVEYCNGTQDTYYANLRRSHGFDAPFQVHQWCLGNEMYAPWQFGRLSGAAYAEKAEQFATAMRAVDPSIALVAVGLETDPDWNLEVVRRLCKQKTRYAPGEWIDALSAHYYPIGCAGAFEGADYDTRMSLGRFFHERTMIMRSCIEAATNDPCSEIGIAWDEWNPMGDRDGTEFTLEMALWSASILNSFIRDSRFVRAANYTFFVGGNGPIQLTEEGVIRHAEYYLFRLYGQLLGSRLLESSARVETRSVRMPADRRWLIPGLITSALREIPLLDMVATGHEDGRIVLFVSNLDKDRDRTLEIRLCEAAQTYGKAKRHLLWNENLHARNSFAQPDLLHVTTDVVSVAGDTLQMQLPRHSISAIEILPN